MSILDEVIYYNSAKILSQFRLPGGVEYPPLYPMLLAPAFWFFGDSLKSLIALNVVYSSLTVVPIFALARMVLPRRHALAATLVTCLLPWNYVMPRTLLSENIYTALLLSAGLFALWAPRRARWAWDGGFGLLLGLLYLARYISLPLIPVLLIVWWMREWGQHAEDLERGALDRLGRFALVLVVAAITFGSWAALQTATTDVTLAHAMGFVITSKTNAAQLTLGRLSLYAAWYGAYLVLLAAPVVGLVLQAMRQATLDWRKDRFPNLYVRFVVFSAAIGAALFVASTRHSWRAYYNYPEPARIMGRYLVVLGPLLIILAFAALVRRRQHPFKSPTGGVLWLFVVPGVLVYAAYRVVLGDWLLPFDIAQITDRGSVDAFAVLLTGNGFWILTGAAIAVAGFFYLSRTRAGGVSAVTVLLMLWLLWPLPAYLAHLQGYQDAAAHGNRVAKSLEGRVPPPGKWPKATVGVSERLIDSSALTDALGAARARAGYTRTVRNSLRFARLRANIAGLDSPVFEADYVLVDAAELTQDSHVIAEWTHRGQAVALVSTAAAEDTAP